MDYSNHDLGACPRMDTYVPKNSNTAKAYLLECKLRQILDEHIKPSHFFRISRQTCLPLLKIEEAIEDRVFLLDVYQLQHCFDLYLKFGIIELILFLHEPMIIQPPVEQQEKTGVSIKELFDQCPRLEEMGYPVELIEEMCQSQELPAHSVNGNWYLNPNSLDLLSDLNIFNHVPG